MLRNNRYVSIISSLNHWGRVTHICVRNLTFIGSDNGLSPGRRQAITWTNVGILLIGPLGTNFSEVVIEIHIFSFKKSHLKMSFGKWRPSCLGLNVLNLGLKMTSLICYWCWRIPLAYCRAIELPMSYVMLFRSHTFTKRHVYNHGLLLMISQSDA